jgi:hypothetical protein
VSTEFGLRIRRSPDFGLNIQPNIPISCSISFLPFFIFATLNCFTCLCRYLPVPSHIMAKVFDAAEGMSDSNSTLNNVKSTEGAIH